MPRTPKHLDVFLSYQPPLTYLYDVVKIQIEFISELLKTIKQQDTAVKDFCCAKIRGLSFKDDLGVRNAFDNQNIPLSVL